MTVLSEIYGLSGASRSYWIEEAAGPAFPALHGDVAADVAIVGGGIVGLTAALLLRRAGRTVVVIESRRVGRQVTGHSTAKVTSQHGLIYAKLIESFGEAGARIYAEANQAAVDRIGGIVADLQIDCDFEPKSAYVYTQSEERLAAIREEVEAARALGLPASFVHETSLPFPVAGAVRFDGQAQFNPYDYLRAIAQSIPGNGSAVYEQTRVFQVEGDGPCRVTTDRGTVTARDVIVATNLPILDRGGYFSKAYPRAHLVLAARISGTAPDGMFLSADTPTHSIRTAHDGAAPVLVVAGPAFKPGQAVNTAAGHRTLEGFVRHHFDVTAIASRWMNQDYNSMDGVPFVGRLLPGTDHIHVATGFSAWGITNGTVAAQILSDAVLNQPNPWAEFFDSTRIKPATSAGPFLRENLQVAKHWTMDRLRGAPPIPLAALAPGDGTVATIGGEKIAVSKDADGHVHAVSAICSHMGCDVTWNNAETSWDCACHGSRFSQDGRVIHGPAVRNLEPKMAVLEHGAAYANGRRARLSIGSAVGIAAAAIAIVAAGVAVQRSWASDRQHRRHGR